MFALGSAFFAGLTAILAKIGVSGVNSNLATLIRTVVIFFVILMIVSARKEWVATEALTRRSLLFLVLSGCATGLSWLCYFRALQMGPASRVAPIDKLSLLFVIVFSAMFLGEPLTWRVAFGGALIGIGTWVLAF
ncbi:MAG: EamA family transporter [Pseudomonadota bacterium]